MDNIPLPYMCRCVLDRCTAHARPPCVSTLNGTEIGYIDNERVIKFIFGLSKGLPIADPTCATGIQLLLNPKLLQCKSFLQRRQRGAVFLFMFMLRCSLCWFQHMFVLSLAVKGSAFLYMYFMIMSSNVANFLYMMYIVNTKKMYFESSS